MSGAHAGPAPVTVWDLLLADQPVPEPAQRRSIALLIHGEKVLKRLTQDARAGVSEQLERLLREALSDRLVDLLFQQVNLYDRLSEARAATLRAPRLVEQVTLADYGWRVEYRPSVTMHLDGVPLLALTAQVELTFRAVELISVVRQGRLSELRAGSMRIDGQLWLQSEPVAQRSVDIPISLVLRTADGGVPLPRGPIDLRSHRIELPPDQRHQAD